jgi:hypothetical protein
MQRNGGAVVAMGVVFSDHDFPLMVFDALL